MFIKDVIFAGGCFWCVEHDLEKAPGVTAVISGYTGGSAETANYETVSNHKTTHREAIRVKYDTAQTNFKKLCQFFLDHIDPTDGGGQFGDRGMQYEPVIFYKTLEEQEIANALLQELADSGIYSERIMVKVLPEKTFYNAEEYHQQYAEKNPGHYSMYRKGSGREDFIAKTCAIREEKNIEWKD